MAYNSFGITTISDLYDETIVPALRDIIKRDYLKADIYLKTLNSKIIKENPKHTVILVLYRDNENEQSTFCPHS